MLSRVLVPLSRGLAASSALSAPSLALAPKLLVPATLTQATRFAPFHSQSVLFADKNAKTVQDDLNALLERITKKEVTFTAEDLENAKRDIAPEYTDEDFGPLEEVTIEELPEIHRIPLADAHFALEFVNEIPFTEHLFEEPPMIKELEDEEVVEEKFEGH